MRHDVRSGDVLQGADVAGDLADPAAADLFLLTVGELAGVADHAALAAAQGDVNHGGLPGHPGGQGAHGVDGLVGVEADAALRGAAGIAVLHAEALEHLDGPVVHAHGDVEVELPGGGAQEVAATLVQAQLLGHGIELLLGHFERVEGFLGHKATPWRVCWFPCLPCRPMVPRRDGLTQ